MYRTFQIRGLAHIGTIGNHNSHGKGHGVEELSHGSQHSFDGKIRHMWHNIVFDAFQGAVDGQYIQRNCHGQYNQQGHHKFTDFFNPFLYTADDDQRSESDEYGKPQNRFTHTGNKAGKIIVFRSGMYPAGKKHCHIFKNPSPNNGIIWKNNGRNNCSQNSHETIVLI